MCKAKCRDSCVLFTKKSISAIQEIEEMLSISVISIVSLEDIISYLELSEDRELKSSLEGVKRYQNLYGV